MSTYPVEVNGVSHIYGPATALKGIDLRLEAGITALVGVNGAGKSTLLRILSGGMRPTKGSVSLAGEDPYSFSSRKASLTKVALMPQIADFPRSLTILETVISVAWLKGLSRASAKARAREVVDAVGLGGRAHSKIGTLSGGMLRRVALAQALASSPEVLLLDEPSTGLDPAQHRGMIDLLSTLEGAVLFSSHVVEDVESLADRIVVLDAGRVRFDGKLEELRSRVQTPVGGSSVTQLETAFLSLITQR